MPWLGTDGGGRIAIWSWWWNEMSLEAMQDEPDFGVWQRLGEIEKKNTASERNGNDTRCYCTHTIL